MQAVTDPKSGITRCADARFVVRGDDGAPCARCKGAPATKRADVLSGSVVTIDNRPFVVATPAVFDHCVRCRSFFLTPRVLPLPPALAPGLSLSLTREPVSTPQEQGDAP